MRKIRLSPRILEFLSDEDRAGRIVFTSLAAVAAVAVFLAAAAIFWMR